ncbi:MAG: PH domain-containing protein [Nitrospira sp.]|nr:PH domain-containing protein [Nitrospira sp.]
MMTLRAVNKPEEQPVVWGGFPSWSQFSWLYFVSAISVLRGALLFRFGVAGWQIWMLGSVVLLACAAILRQWAHYDLTRDQISVRNGYTGREIESMPLRDMESVTVQQGVIADFFGIGTVLVYARHGDRVLSMRGVRYPEDVKLRIETVAWRHKRAANHHRENS